VAQIAQHRFFSDALLVRLRIGIGRRFMRIVGAALARQFSRSLVSRMLLLNGIGALREHTKNLWLWAEPILVRKRPRCGRSAMHESDWLQRTSPAFRLMIATSWLAPKSCQKHQEEAIRQAIGAKPDWAEYLRLVDRHRTPALSWAALGRVPDLAVPEPAKQELRGRNDACRVQAVRHCLQLGRVLKGFNRTGIPVMPLKGPILSSELYGDVGLRQSKDIDLAVAPDDLYRAQACLNDLDWHLDSSWFPMTPRQWERLLRTEQHLSFIQSQGGCVLELHWRNHWDPPGLDNTRWARSILSVWQGCFHQEMDPIDQVLYLCGHGGAHAWFRAKWLGDLARIHTAGRVNWQAALDHAISTGQEKPLLVCLQLLYVVHGLPMPGLQRNPSENLPSFLVESPLREIRASKDPASSSAIDVLSYLLRLSYYKKLVQPRRTWRESLSELAYSREDCRVLRLPDSLFWAYVPLRPVLWAWRKFSRLWAR